MPTLAEGGGSFPVLEALGRGVPVVCSDIPVLREQMGRYQADVLWFDPHEPAEPRVRRSAALETNYADRKAVAINQVRTMARRTWDEVASDYWRRFDDQIQAAVRPLRAAV
jgi:glycosyltransferase involved in cell wall biosynthesis